MELCFTFLIHLLLILILSIIQTALLWGIAQRYRRLNRSISIDSWQLFIWTVTALTLICANIYFFPLSVFSKLFLPEVPITIVSILLLISTGILLFLLINTLARLSKTILAGLTLLFFVVLVFSFWQTKNAPIKQSKSLPNVIIIGVDSLSPTNIKTSNTPFLKTSLNKSVYFSNTVSPLAHTFPSWMSILTGLYPFHHQATYNLKAISSVRKELSLAWKLKRKGYTTIYATDDRRFNSIDEQFGFETIIGPKKGVNDVLLGGFNDFPLSNLIANLPFSRWIFPYNYMNRASFYTYYPYTFNLALQKGLAQKKEGPFFIAVHFALPHWPYAWAVTKPAQVNDIFDIEKRGNVYYQALGAVDNQVASLFSYLKKYHYLDNSLVILLSDHGETLYLPGTRQTSYQTYQGEGESKLANYFKRKTSTALNMSVGHGSDLLSADQYHCLFAMQIYKDGKLVTTPQIINTQVSLIDIMPTIENFLAMKKQNVDGISLLPFILKNKPLPKRTFIMESGMLPNQFVTQEKARILAKKYFQIADNGELELKYNELSNLDQLKLYGVIKDNWLFVLYPDDDGYIPVILRLDNNYWSDSMNDSFTKNSPASEMLQLLHTFYGKRWPLITDKN
ncbi:putative Sulfatase (plasmid) [Legionella adelaidensis]|uniref:Putative Sulfatase n=2 Tax=Legionella adelaidensis TaxID=45056 RepID=A0A0W0R2I6_9GAMM|nr:sulfatase-like hydrolase/transferase [Legionella adelaidensis]KTC65284.1 putative Sulfatase [Legionella adelaidensis]VEH81225.1 putative Sulfatase [Legionella adelaidensis]